MADLVVQDGGAAPRLVEGTALLCDLDTVFSGDASALSEPGLCAMEDHFHKTRLSSALLRWEGDQLGFVHDAFRADPERWMKPGSCGPVPNAVHGDQVVIDHLLRQRGIKPDFFQHRHPGLLDFYDPDNPRPGPVLVFIGDAKPISRPSPSPRSGGRYLYQAGRTRRSVRLIRPPLGNKVEVPG